MSQCPVMSSAAYETAHGYGNRCRFLIYAFFANFTPFIVEKFALFQSEILKMENHCSSSHNTQYTYVDNCTRLPILCNNPTSCNLKCFVLFSQSTLLFPHQIPAIFQKIHTNLIQYINSYNLESNIFFTTNILCCVSTIIISHFLKFRRPHNNTSPPRPNKGHSLEKILFIFTIPSNTSSNNNLLVCRTFWNKSHNGSTPPHGRHCVRTCQSN